jgi:parallel beta-helix repeat protein
MQLAPGNYSSSSGEIFPIVIADGVVLLGDDSRQGRGVIITGNGAYNSASFATQNITLLADGSAEIRGVTVTNPVRFGTGIWIETGHPTIADCTFSRCQREGIFVTGQARPLVTNCLFSRNASNGLTIARQAKGEYHQNTFQDTGFGVTISDSAAPLLVENQILNNVVGIVLARACRPVLRRNTIAGSRQSGIIVQDTALPDLGMGQDPGQNRLSDNLGEDLHNSTNPPVQLVSVGNQLNLAKVIGNVALMADESPPPAPVIDTPPLMPAASPKPVPPPPEPVPLPAPPVSPPVSSPSPAPQPGRLSDIQGHWAELFIQALVARDIIFGFPDGSFRPEAPLTRVQYAAMIAKTYDLPNVRSAPAFTDVGNEFWGATAIARASKMGFLAGFPDQTFRPGLNLTRVQAIVSLVNGLQFQAGQPSVLQIYGDRAQVPGYAINAIATGTQRRMIVNYPNPRLLNPLRDITRAEVSAILYQSLVSINRAEPIESPYIVTPDLSMLHFTDLETHWSKDFILPLAAQDLVRGYGDGAFKPDLPINRVQFAAIVTQAFNPPPQRDTVMFSDVPLNFWGVRAIEQAYRGGFAERFTDGTFRPAAGMTRVELIQGLVQGLSVPPANPQLLAQLSDRDVIPSAARAAVAAAIAAGIVVNYPNQKQLQPNQPATRADMATMVYQALVYQRRMRPITSSYVILVPPPVPPSPAQNTAASRTIVAIDPGHGGPDPGAVGHGGIQEKEIVLDISLQVARMLSQHGVQAVLTRDADHDLDLQPRVDIAEQAKATLFVSIHANAFRMDRPDINGLETYYHQSGLELAEAIHSNVLRQTKVADRQVRQARFYVLQRTSMPAVLVETGFVTGETDAANLNQPDYRRNMAQGIAHGILQHLKLKQDSSSIGMILGSSQ